MIFRAMVFAWVILMQVFVIAASIRLFFSPKPFNIAISIFVREFGYCLIWPLLLFTGTGRNKLYRLFQFK